MEKLDGYVLDTDAEDFLRSSPNLVPVLKEAHQQVCRVFVSKTKLPVSVNNYGYGDKELFVAIPVNCSVVEAEHRLDRFEDEYWFDQPLEARQNILFDVRFTKSDE